jgi:hypothetical protein
MFTPLSIVGALQLRAALGLTPSFPLCVSARQDRIRRCRIVGKRRSVIDARAVRGSYPCHGNAAPLDDIDGESPLLLRRQFIKPFDGSRGAGNLDN